MKCFKRGAKGSVTVFVTLILVPTIFFTGLLVDLARIRLYGSQAVMTADNYGEMVISQYDNLLKEMYGLFGIAQGEEAEQYFKELEAYAKTSFNPKDSTVDWEHLAGLLNGESLSGFMPYKSADIELSYAPLENFNLSNTDILATQIGNFMRYRILLNTKDDEGTDFLNACNQIKNAKNQVNVINDYQEFANKIEDLNDTYKDYYNVLVDIDGYYDDEVIINNVYKDAKDKLSNIINSRAYSIYKDYITNESEISAALKKKSENKPLTESDEKYIQMDAKYQDSDDAQEIKENLISIGEETEKRINAFKTFRDFDDKVSKLEKCYNDIEAIITEISSAQAVVEEDLEELPEDDEMRKTIEETLAELTIDKDSFEMLLKKEKNNLSVNANNKEILKQINSSISTAVNNCINGNTPTYGPEINVNGNGWFELDYLKADDCNKLYEMLREICTKSSGSELTKEQQQAMNIQDDSQKMTDEYKEKLKEDDTPKTTRNIPESIGIGNPTGAWYDNWLLGNTVDEIASLFDKDMGNALNSLLLKFFTINYDYDMFTTRITNVNIKDSEKYEESATGITKCGSVNYLYQSEMEYIIAGYRNATDNLNYCKSRINGIRETLNFISTYRIPEINSAIKAIAAIANGIPYVGPIVSVILELALRAAISTAETYFDWVKMTTGEKDDNKVVFFKNKLDECTMVDNIKDLLGDTLKDTAKTSDSTEIEIEPLSLGYEDFLNIFLYVFSTSDDIFSRTGDLITLNVNTVKQQLCESKEIEKLEFDLKKSYTMVKSSCNIHMNFIIIPPNFSNMLLDSDAKSNLNSFEQNWYKYSVIRGY